MGAFASAGFELTRRGLAVLPLGGDDGKEPLTKWRNLKYSYSPKTVQALIEKFPNANIGIINKLSRILIVDIDDPGLLMEMIERFGETPLKTKTPSGGVHLWYRSSGEGCFNLRNAEGLAVDIKGIGGQVVVPPSIRFNGEHAGRAYEFLEGSWDDLERLPKIRPGRRAATNLPPAGGSPAPLRAVKEGHRGVSLFRWLLRSAPHCDTEDDLLDVAETMNADFLPPMSAADVKRAVRSAWEYETEGRNWVGKEQRVYATASELDALEAQKGGDAGLMLFMKLRRLHSEREQFAVAPHAMARAQVIPGWGVRQYRSAMKAIMGAGLMKQQHRGGRFVGDASLFTFADRPARSNSALGAHNTKITPSSFPPSAFPAPERERRRAGGSR